MKESGYYNIHNIAGVEADRAISFMVYAEYMFHTLKLAGKLPEVTKDVQYGGRSLLFSVRLLWPICNTCSL